MPKKKAPAVTKAKTPKTPPAGFATWAEYWTAARAKKAAKGRPAVDPLARAADPPVAGVPGSDSGTPATGTDRAPTDKCDTCGWHGAPMPKGGCPNDNCPRYVRP